MSTNQFYFSQSKVKFINYNYNRGVFFDEKKKRFVDFDDMDNLTYENYNKPFITVNITYIISYIISTVLICLVTEVSSTMLTYTKWLSLTCT